MGLQKPRTRLVTHCNKYLQVRPKQLYLQIKHVCNITLITECVIERSERWQTGVVQDRHRTRDRVVLETMFTFFGPCCRQNPCGEL